MTISAWVRGIAAMSVAVLREVECPAGESLAYLLAKPGVTTLVVGARKDEQLLDNLGAVDVQLTGEEIDRLDEISAPALVYPHWHQARTAADRLGAADRALHGPPVALRQPLADDR